MELKIASDIAVNICYKLKPHCVENRILIAGGIKRKKVDVHDIEIVALPKSFGIFNLLHEQVGLMPDPNFSLLVKSLGTVEIGKPDGRYMKIMLPENIKLDLFLPQPHDYFRQYAIRVGNKDYSARVIAPAWLKKGWCGTKDGLRLITESFKDSNDVWHCRSKTPTLPPAWESEQAFFDWLNIKYVEPVYRNI